MSLVIGDGITSRLETPRDLNSSARHSDPLNQLKQEPQALLDNMSSNMLSLANQFTTQDHPSESDLGLKDIGNETPMQAVSTTQDGKNFIKVPHRKKGRGATMKSKERYFQVEKVYNVYLAKKEPTHEAIENNSTAIKEDKLPKVQSSSPTKMVPNHRSRFAMFSPYTKIKDGDEKDAKVISTKGRAASQPLVSIAGEGSEQKSQKKTYTNLLEKLPQIFLYSEQEDEVNSFIYSKKPVENSEAFHHAKKTEPTRKKSKSKELPPIYSKQKLNDIQKQYSRSQNQSDGLEKLGSKNRRKSFPKRSSQLKFSLLDANTENRAYTFETSMNNSLTHQSPVKKDFKRQRSSTGQSDRISTQPSNKLQSDSFNDNNQEIQSFLEVPEKIFKNKLPSKTSQEKIIKPPSELFPATNNNISGRHRSKSSSRYDNQQTDILIKANDSMVHIPPKQEPSSPERPKIIKSESLPQNQNQYQHQQAKFLPRLDSSPKKHAPTSIIQERYIEIMKAKKDERKLTDDQRYQQLIKNKIEDQFTELFRHFRNKKTRNNKRVQFITET